MRGKGKDKGFNSGADKGSEAEVNEMFTDEGQSEVINRNELMELTGKELAKKAQQYSTLQLTSLQRMSKAKLCDIIINKTDKTKDEEAPKARTARTESESEQLISTALMMLNAIKQNRDKEPLNPMASEVFKKQAVAYADEKVNNNEMDINKASSLMFAVSAGALLFDGLVGFKNAPSLIEKVKNKFSKKEDKKSNDTK